MRCTFRAGKRIPWEYGGKSLCSYTDAVKPRGFGEDGLSGEENARKEVFEETGLTAERLVLLNTPSEPVSYFYAECSGEIRCGDRGEGIKSLRLCTLEETKELFLEGAITDSFTTRAYVLSSLRKLI